MLPAQVSGPRPLLVRCPLPRMPFSPLSVCLDTESLSLMPLSPHSPVCPPLPIPSLRTGATDVHLCSEVAQGQRSGLLSLCPVNAQHRLGTEQAPGKGCWWGWGDVRLWPRFLGATWRGRCLPCHSVGAGRIMGPWGRETRSPWLGGPAPSGWVSIAPSEKRFTAPASATW